MRRTVTCSTAALIVMPLLFSLSTLSIFAAQNRPGAVKQSKAVKTGPAVTLTVLNPQGPVKKVRDLAPRLGTLEGKKIAMWLSSTADQLYAGKGAELYEALAKMLKEEFPGIQIVPYTSLPMKFAPENDVVAAIVAAKPDGVVAGFGG